MPLHKFCGTSTSLSVVIPVTLSDNVAPRRTGERSVSYAVPVLW